VMPISKGLAFHNRRLKQGQMEDKVQKKPAPSKPGSALSFTAQIGPHGVLRLPAGAIPWKVGDRIYWLYRERPYATLMGSPHPLASLYKGRYMSSRLKAVGYYSHALAHKALLKECSSQALRLAHQIAVHRQRIQRRKV